MTLEQQFLDKLDTLIKIFTGATNSSSNQSQRQNNSNSQNGNGNSNNVSTETLANHNRLMTNINNKTKEIQKNVFSYETTYKRIIRLDKEAKKLKDEIDKGIYTGNRYLSKQLELAHKINEIERERARLQIEGHTKLDDYNEIFEKRTTAIKKAVSEIKRGYADIVNSVKKTLEP